MRVRIENTEMERSIFVVRRYKGSNAVVTTEIGPDQSQGFRLIMGQSLEIFRDDDPRRPGFFPNDED